MKVYYPAVLVYCLDKLPRKHVIYIQAKKKVNE